MSLSFYVITHDIWGPVSPVLISNNQSQLFLFVRLKIKVWQHLIVFLKSCNSHTFKQSPLFCFKKESDENKLADTDTVPASVRATDSYSGHRKNYPARWQIGTLLSDWMLAQLEGGQAGKMAR